MKKWQNRYFEIQFDKTLAMQCIEITMSAYFSQQNCSFILAFNFIEFFKLKLEWLNVYIRAIFKEIFLYLQI